jgi:hypothetical protein
LAEEPEINEGFLREVDDELRRSELAAFWKKWAGWLIGGLVLGLAAFGGWLYTQDQNRIAAGKDAEQLSAALADATDGRQDEALKKIDAVANSPRDGYRAPAMMAKAAIALQKGDTKSAIAAYAAIASDADTAKPWRDIALIRQTAVEFDTLKPDIVIARLQPLAVKGNAWFGSAGEMVAMAYLKQGKIALAARIFSELGKDEQVPETIRTRAVQMASAMEVNATTAKPETIKP